MENKQFQFACDRFLDQNDHSDDAYDTLGRVLDKYEALVQLAIKHALDELFYTNLPENVIPITHATSSQIN